MVTFGRGADWRSANNIEEIVRMAKSTSHNLMAVWKLNVRNDRLIFAGRVEDFLKENDISNFEV